MLLPTGTPPGLVLPLPALPLAATVGAAAAGGTGSKVEPTYFDYL